MTNIEDIRHDLLIIIGTALFVLLTSGLVKPIAVEEEPTIFV